MARRTALAADGIVLYEFPTDAVGEDRRHNALDLQLGPIGPVDRMQPGFDLHGLHPASQPVVPIRLDPILDVAKIGLARARWFDILSSFPSSLIGAGGESLPPEGGGIKPGTSN
jgi:hypothetical protein